MLTSCLNKCRCADCLLFGGRLDYGAYIDRCEEEDRDGPRLAPRPEPADAESDPSADEPLTPLSSLGQPRKWRDTNCRCDRPLPVIEWHGPRVPLERWCHHCGRIMSRPRDRQFPLSDEDRALALPTVEVAMIAGPVL